MTSVPARKSTIVRARTSILRAGFRAAERVAPALGARVAASLWFRIPPAPPPLASPEHGIGFEVASMGGVVRGTYWGAGPVVYLVHGWGGRGDQLAAFVEPLVGTGHRVVTFDAPSHGASDPGPSGRGRAHGVEFGRALDDVAARFGPARAVVAHSMGCVSALLALRDGWLGTERLVLVAPMSDLATYFDRFEATAGFGSRIRAGLNRETERRTGYPVAAFDLRGLAADVEPMPPTLVVHDRRDRETPYESSVAAVHEWADARLVGTDGLGHRRILRDAAVVGAAVGHVVAAAADPGDEVDAIA